MSLLHTVLEELSLMNPLFRVGIGRVGPAHGQLLDVDVSEWTEDRVKLHCRVEFAVRVDYERPPRLA